MEELQNYYNGHANDGYKLFGSFVQKEGVFFRVHAPSATRIFVIGSWNNFQEVDEMHNNFDGTYSITISNAKVGDIYKYVIYNNNRRMEKTDPYARSYELRPNSGSIIYESNFKFTDQDWMKNRTKCYNDTLNIYEMHLGAWKNIEGGTNYRSIAAPLIEYIKKENFTHVELMPLTEYPFDGSWGYQAYGYFACTKRYGEVDDLKYLVNELHKAGIGVIIDYVLVHFVKDEFGLCQFDGTCLYEYKDEGNRLSEWDTYNFDLTSNIVRSFLTSSVFYFLREFHFDGVRVDAVSNLIYWKGNKNNGVNNGAVYFIQQLNDMVHQEFDDKVMMIAEDSTDFPHVTHPTADGGLGFDYKWCLGWMNDTLKYFSTDPVYRKYDHHKLTFSMMYNYSENYILPLSHDEVVHGKMSIVSKMFGLYEERFAQAKALYTYMYMHPGHKLNFMGNELGQMIEFDENRELDWLLLMYPQHVKFNQFFIDLNTFYRNTKAISATNFGVESFRWINADKTDDNVYLFSRFYGDEYYVFVMNTSRNYYENYGVGVHHYGIYHEVINTDDLKYGGFGVSNGEVKTELEENDNLEQRIKLNIAPLSAIILKLDTRLEDEKAYLVLERQIRINDEKVNETRRALEELLREKEELQEKKVKMKKGN